MSKSIIKSRQEIDSFGSKKKTRQLFMRYCRFCKKKQSVSDLILLNMPVKKNFTCYGDFPPYASLVMMMTGRKEEMESLPTLFIIINSTSEIRISSLLLSLQPSSRIRQTCHPRTSTPRWFELNYKRIKHERWQLSSLEREDSHL